MQHIIQNADTIEINAACMNTCDRNRPDQIKLINTLKIMIHFLFFILLVHQNRYSFCKISI